MPDARLIIRTFISDRLPQVEFSDDDEIFELGLVNSLFAVELVMFIERTFDLVLPNEVITLDNFRNVAAMAEMIELQQAQAVRSK